MATVSVIIINIDIFLRTDSIFNRLDFVSGSKHFDFTQVHVVIFFDFFHNLICNKLFDVNIRMNK